LAGTIALAWKIAAWRDPIHRLARIYTWTPLLGVVLEKGMLMAASGRTVRKIVFGLSLGLAVAAGATACGSSSAKTNPGNAPSNTAPATTSSGGGGVSY
jgi:hypothetical protein